MEFQKSVTTALPYADAVAAVRAALTEQGSVMTAFAGTDALVGVAAEAGDRLDAVLAALAGR